MRKRCGRSADIGVLSIAPTHKIEILSSINGVMNVCFRNDGRSKVGNEVISISSAVDLTTADNSKVRWLNNQGLTATLGNKDTDYFIVGNFHIQTGQYFKLTVLADRISVTLTVQRKQPLGAVNRWLCHCNGNGCDLIMRTATYAGYGN